MIYFASDFHLGIDVRHTTKEREKRLVSWLSSIEDKAKEIYFVGDMFDFWFEYKHVIPKGFTRFIGQLARLKDKGIAIYVFTGNHDMWLFDYFPKELGIPIFREPIIREFNGKRFYIGHGDGLGPGDYGYKIIKRIFANKICQWMFSFLHPTLAFAIANYWSGKSRAHNKESSHFLGGEKEWLVQYCEGIIREQTIDFFVFGHRHLPIDYELSNKTSRYINLGDWMNHYSYAQFDGQDLQLLFYQADDGRVYP